MPGSLSQPGARNHEAPRTGWLSRGDVQAVVAAAAGRFVGEGANAVQITWQRASGFIKLQELHPLTQQVFEVGGADRQGGAPL